MIESKTREIYELEVKLKDSIEENESAAQLIHSLRFELKLQEEHFNKQLKLQTDYQKAYAERETTDQDKITELMQKISDD